MAISGFDDASDKFTTRGGRDLIASRHHEGKKEGLLRSADHIAKFTIWQTTTASGHLDRRALKPWITAAKVVYAVGLNPTRDQGRLNEGRSTTNRNGAGKHAERTTDK